MTTSPAFGVSPLPVVARSGGIVSRERGSPAASSSRPASSSRDRLSVARSCSRHAARSSSR